ncbi:RNA polymerase, sigma-24 subunit, ECF subfamily [Ruminiclostridium papyrosolvens DSM 2782]|uniref:RNA polymerase, sigma-24 subunit, ECF subfamily n=1 Tax=Ruminiclostridium papyrosolvens DSM 2782 TaxID=588581 RepID=F1TIE3_9FIRM|nr:sigma-70 family RNA polymerase sigma factor [Ruminiclostridium papyrosolvens]EGD45760.1 RNA polymerase, sigma-24 subunit, ECF subfamily [Ruminiclostridium papyrosolvens DSM 2782]WES33919.1 sigma-70 family RNA polymerase sigma factor [Ruminiclostridium papyrosolvens DSM 2782]
MNQVDLEKAVKAINGDKIASSELILERKEDIYRIAYVYMRNENDALDVLHDTIYRSYISIKKLKNPKFFNTWLTRIVINCSLNALKRKKKINDNEDKMLNEDIKDINTENTEDSIISGIDLMTSIERLAFSEKTIVILKYFQDLTVSQISEVLSCPIGTVKTRLNRALKLLRTDVESKI